VGGGIAGAAPTGGASLLLSAVGQQRAAEIGAQGQHEYLNGDGQTVRWHFRGVLEIQELCETKITHGVEVFSRIFRKSQSLTNE
jgi:hypothetical protein